MPLKIGPQSKIKVNITFNLTNKEKFYGWLKGRMCN
jgi:hypothetical protein